MLASELEETFAGMIRLTPGLGAGMIREYVFAHPRRWRFDFAWPDRKVAAELEGGVYSGGRHTRGGGFQADCEKYNEAALGGWLVLRCTSEMVASGVALSYVERALWVRA